MRLMNTVFKWLLMMVTVVAVVSAHAEVLSVFDASGQSQIVWSDDGTYGALVLNRIDQFGNLRIVEYAKVTDSSFTRDSFTLNTDYTRTLLNDALTSGGVDITTAYGDRLTTVGTLDTDNGWMLVDNGNGTHNVNNSGRYVFGNPQWRIPTLGDYAAKESTIKAQTILDHISGTSVNENGVLVNGSNEPFLQIVTQDSSEWNLRSNSDSGAGIPSTGINGQAIGITAFLSFESVPVELSGMTINFLTSTNAQYRISSTTNLTSNGWMIETNFTGSGITNSFEMVPIYSNQFFKVEVAD